MKNHSLKKNLKDLLALLLMLLLATTFNNKTLALNKALTEYLSTVLSKAWQRSSLASSKSYIIIIKANLNK